MTAQELIERYVQHVGAQLRRNVRGDVMVELRSNLQDALEQRAARAGVEPHEPIGLPMAVAMLREFGKPETVAARYQSQQPLIGPALFPAFKAVAFWNQVLIAGGFLFWFVISSSSEFLPVSKRLSGWGEALAEYFALAMTNLGFLVLMFAAIERIWKPKPAEEASEDWDPAGLEAAEDKDRIDPGDLVFGMYLTAGVAVLFNFYPNWVPLLRDGFQAYLPILNLWWAAAFALDLTVLQDGRWRRGTRWGQVALGLAECFILYLLIVGEDLFSRWLFFDVRLGLKIALAFTLMASVLRVYRLLTAPDSRFDAPGYRMTL